MDWYDGPTLMQHLETVDLGPGLGKATEPVPFRMPVQWVNRPHLDFRGFAGLIAEGAVRPGDAVRVLPSGRTSTVERIVTFDGDLAEAVAGQSVTLTLADEVDCSRGDVLAAAGGAAAGGRPVPGDDRVDGGRGDAARPSLSAQAGDADRLGYAACSRNIRSTSTRWSMSRRSTLGLNAIGVVELVDRQADHVRALCDLARSGRLHPDRSHHQRDRRAPG